MGLTLARNQLISAASRAQIGARKLNFSNIFSREETQQNGGVGGIIRRIFSGAGRLIGFLSRVIGRLGISVTSAFGWLLARATDFVNFDWNASDRQLQGAIRGRNLNVVASWGATLGSAFGWTASLVMGYGIGMVVPVIGGSQLARLVASGVGQEALEEVSVSLFNTIRVTAQAMLSNATTSLYIRFRRAVKGVSRAKLVELLGPEVGNFVKDKWGNEGGPSWTIAGAINRATNNVFNNEYLQAFLEEFRDEAWESFVEGGFIIANQLDEAIAQSRAGAAQVAGETHAVLVTPDRDSPQESYALVGRREALKEQIQSTIHQHRMLYNKDVGEIVGMPAQDWVRAQPRMRSLVIVFQDKERPPFRHPDGRRVKSATYTIPEPKPGLSWRQIKTAAATYDWGKYRATANLKSRRQMAVYGATPQQAERKLRKLLELSTDEIMTLSISEEKDRNPNVRKNPTRMFPAYVTFIIRRPTTDTGGRFIDDRRWDEETKRYPLWTAQPPSDFVPMLQSGRNE